ncbi:MAG: ECF transporter S component, partial [Eubacterium sp.]|nr:ECF transporter S component [Eubacterium sp.]
MLVTTALMMCMTMVMTFIIRIPIPATQGYIHLGVSIVYL